MDTGLLPLILAGEPELSARLGQSHLRQLKQRIALRCVLGQLNLNEPANYVAGRIRLAGGDPSSVFLGKPSWRSTGTPVFREVSASSARTRCSGGFANARRRISGDLVAEVCRDLDFAGAHHDATGPAANPDSGGIETFRSPAAGPRPVRPADRKEPGLTSEITRLRHLLTARSRRRSGRAMGAATS